MNRIFFNRGVGLRVRLALSLALLMMLAACGGTPNTEVSAATGEQSQEDDAGSSTQDSAGSEADAAEPQELTPLAIQTYPGIWTNALVWVALDQGFYEEEGLDVSAIDVGSGPQGIAALQSGSIQLAQSTSDNLVVSLEKGMDLRVVTGNFGQIYTLMAAADADLPNYEKGYPESVQDLKGKSIGITAPGASTDMLAQVTVQDAGLATPDVDFVAVGGTSGQIAALEAGTVDAVIAMVPQDSVFEASGAAKTLVNYGGDTGPKAIQNLNACFQTYFGLTSWVEKNADLAAGFARAHARAADWANEPGNFTELVRIMQENGSIAGVDDPQLVAETATRKMVDNGLLYTDISEDCLKGWSDYLFEFEVIQEPVDVAGVVWTGS